MGIDLVRFIGEIDEEFQCSICSMVLQNPVQTACDHLFCSECINDWLSTNPSCPVDSKPLAIIDLTPIHRTVRNLLNKFEIKCDFNSQGCKAVVQLQCLQDHVASCDSNPDVPIVCDKGCNLEMSRREYQATNCFAHLSFSHKKEMARVIQELSSQKEHFDRQKEHSVRQGEEIERLSNKMIQLSNEVTQIRREKDQLEGVTSRQEEEVKKLSEKLQQNRQQQNPFKILMQQQKQKFSNFYYRTEISSKAQIKWELIDNIKTPFDHPDVLETDDKRWRGYVRAFHPSEPKNASLKVQFLSGVYFNVGLSSKEQTNGQFEWFASYNSFFGSLFINRVTVYEGSQCKIGDIIEIGIKFPLDFVNNGNASVQLYVSINERVVTEKLVEMPIDAIYPTIQISDRNTKIKVFDV